MNKENRYTIKNFKKDFPTDEACLELLFDKLHSRQCSCGGTYAKLAGRQQYQCSKCRFQIAPMAGTIFHKSSTPLSLWFHAIYIFSTAKSGISAKQMQSQLGVTYKTAWRIMHLIRKSLGQSKKKLSGTVEMDEGYFGGKSKQTKKMDNKSTVIGAVERGGVMKAEVVPNAQAHTINQFLVENIDKVESQLYTDGSNRYKIAAQEYERFSINHADKEFVLGPIHTNNIDSFWGHVKRSIKGSYKRVSKQHFQSYLDAFVWHYNNRHSDKYRFDQLLTRVVRIV